MSIDEQRFEGQHAADPTDRAGAEVEAIEQEAREMQQRAMRRLMPPPRDDGSGLCADEDCGEEVEPERLELGLGLCLSCAEQRERQRLRAKRGY